MYLVAIATKEYTLDHFFGLVEELCHSLRPLGCRPNTIKKFYEPTVLVLRYRSYRSRTGEGNWHRSLQSVPQRLLRDMSRFARQVEELTGIVSLSLVFLQDVACCCLLSRSRSHRKDVLPTIFELKIPNLTLSNCYYFFK